jgi:mannose-6-phosphate isomerase-like protein (cupin superfamily)
VPFTLVNLKRGPEDVGPKFDGAPDLEFRLATDALELEQSGLSYQRVPPGYRFPYGHTHERQEEVYVVVRGGGRMKLDDELVELEEWDAVRVPPGTWRGYEAGPEGLELLVVGAPSLGDDRPCRRRRPGATGGPTSARTRPNGPAWIRTRDQRIMSPLL